jgi:hypothetical protein
LGPKDKLRIKDEISTWGTITVNQQHRYVPITLDTAAELDVVSISFVRGLRLQPCTKKKHDHQLPPVEGAGISSVKTYGVYHLKFNITDERGYTVSAIRPFMAIDRSPKDNPILLGRPILRELGIVVDNGTGTWEFGRRVKIETLLAANFAKKLKTYTIIMQVQVAFRTPTEDNEDDPFDEPPDEPPDLTGIPESLRHRFANVFDTRKA